MQIEKSVHEQVGPYGKGSRAVDGVRGVGSLLFY